MTTNITDLEKDGFSLDTSSLALLSLKLSLKAYFSTYKSMKYGLQVFFPENENKYSMGEISDHIHTSSYVENCYEAIVHFHHFVELVCKEILRDEHILLADFTSSHHHVILHNILNGHEIIDTDYQKLQSIPFKVALNRLEKLISKEKIKNYQQWDFIRKEKKWLETLGHLRNRFVHRGVFVLQYPALDQLFGVFVLPFVKNVILTKRYSGKENFWKFGNLKYNIDPIEAIISELKKGEGGYNIGKIAFLKELARAAYEQSPWVDYKAKDIGNKNYFVSFVGDDRRNRAERIANSEKSNVSEVRECPVCGTSSLVIYDDIKVEGEITLEGNHFYEKAWRYTWQALCLCCTFEVHRPLENPKEYGISIDDFWYGEELK